MNTLHIHDYVYMCNSFYLEATYLSHYAVYVCVSSFPLGFVEVHSSTASREGTDMNTSVADWSKKIEEIQNNDAHFEEALLEPG